MQATQRWLDQFVIAEGLCPFAQAVRQAEQIRFQYSQASDTTALLSDLEFELLRLQNAGDDSTTLLIHPLVLQDFDDYNQFLEIADELLSLLELHGTIQIASFHPQYQFAGTSADAAENYTNRSPYPMLHLLQEESVERAVASHPNIEQVPERNIERMCQITTPALEAILAGIKR
ncbi:MAG: DUF1415 domain-containing protein [Pseudomonadota bacterium]